MSCRHLDAPATPTMLRLAPQLAVLAVLDEALSTSVAALLAHHPELLAMNDPSCVAKASDARRLWDALARSSHLLADYRLSIAAMIADLDTTSLPPHDVDIPF